MALVASRAARPTFEAGQRIDDFDLLAPLGKGAFATVFLARQCSMQRLVALEDLARSGLRAANAGPARSSAYRARVRSAAIGRRHKLRLLYMQYVAGGTLQGVVEHVRRLPPAVRSGAALIEAIDRALVNNGRTAADRFDDPLSARGRHLARGRVLARRPAGRGAGLCATSAACCTATSSRPTCWSAADGHPKLADFNISFSKLDGATPAAYFGGSLAYMSPEQLEACDPAHCSPARRARRPQRRLFAGRDAVGAADAAGARLPKMRCPPAGRRPWARWPRSAAQGVPPRRSAMVPADCPPGLVDVLLKCLAAEADRAIRLGRRVGPRARPVPAAPRPRRCCTRNAAGDRSFKRHPVASTIAIGLLPNVVM